MFTQMSAKKGIESLNNWTVAAIVKKYKNIDDRNAVVPKIPDVLTAEQMWKSLRTVNLIKEKKCGKIKG